MSRDSIALWGRTFRLVCLIVCCAATCQQELRAQDPEACSTSHWGSTLGSWCPTSFQPVDGLCSPDPASTLLGAFGITDTSAAPGTFDPALTLLGATGLSGGTFENALAQGTAALLSASHPDILYPVDASLVSQMMRDAFDGSIDFALALQGFTAWNSVEGIGGCPLACPDQTPPTISCDTLITLECGELADPPTVTDDQDPDPTITFVDSIAYGACLLETTITRVWFAIDSCGNTATTTQTIVTSDTTPPALTIPGDLQLGCFDPTNSPQTGTASAVDTCDTYPLVTFSDEVTPGNCPSTLTIARTWTATDACGNSTSATQTIEFSDDNAPSLTVPPSISVGCTTDCDDLSSEVGNASASDDCDPTPTVTYTDTINAGTCPQERTITRTWTATDACGNSTSDTQLISVIDDEAPILTSPGDVTLSCADPLELAGTPFLADGCDLSPTVTFTDSVAPGNCEFESVITRNYTATDACGNTSSCTQVITIVDDSAPALYCPVTVTLDCTDDPSSLPSATAIDDCDPAPAITFTDNASLAACPNDSTILRTWTATDACGNVSTMVQTILFVDLEAPTITCPAVEMLPCGSTLDFLEDATATDNCDSDPALSFTDESLDGTCPGQSLVVRTWTATDECGNTSTCTQSIFFLDEEPPALSIPAEMTLSCDSTADTGTATATDNCDDLPVVAFTDTTASDGCEHSFTVTRTWTATDGCGNVATADQLIHYVDDTPPTISCLLNVELDCTDLLSSVEPATATDDCDSSPDLVFSDETFPGSCPANLTIERTWTATDACGNVSTQLQVITITDETAPTLDAPADTTLSCEEPLSNAGEATATDDCCSATVTSTDVTFPGDCGFEMMIERTWVATDDCGNTSTHLQMITIVDTTPPTITCPADFDLPCGSIVPSGPQATATDNCDLAPVITFSDVTLPGDCPHESTVERTWAATDSCGNVATCLQIISIVDDEPPFIECPGLVQLDCTDSLDQVEPATATDNCDTAPTLEFTDMTFPGSCPQESTVTRVWTATDACGNTQTRFQSIIFSDNTAPEIFCAEDVTISCDDLLEDVAPATTTDDCDPSPALDMVDTTNPGPCDNTYSITRTYTATDACGNQSVHVQTINVEDTVPPVLTCPGLVELSCTDDLGSVALATATDNCDGAPAVTFDDTTEPGSCPQESTITRVFTATDECGNSSTTTQIITISDEEPPVISVEPLVELDCTESVGDVALATATDNCDGDPLVTFEDATTLLGCAQTYSILRTYTATDACGNTSTATQTINVTDAEAPAISCLAEVFLDCPEDESSVAPATTTDNCDPAPSLTSNDVITPGACPQEYTVTRTYTATDECGNEAVTIQTITISDDEAPQIDCPADITLECYSEYGPEIAGFASATDTCCDAPEITWVDSIFATVCPLDSRIERTWTATDACGNATSCVQTILLVDDTAPVIDCALDVTISCDDDLADVDLATATDNCDGAPSLEMNDVTNPGPCANTYSVTRTWTATDACGNQSTHVQTISVVDIEPPVLTCPGLVELSCTDDLGSVALATATDNCDGAPAVTFDDTTEPGSCPQESTITRVFTATDECGNSSTTTQIITISDEEPPVISVEPLVELDCTENVGDVALATATDNCDGDPLVTFEDETTLLGCAQTYSILRTFTATDACGNSSTATQTINVTDSEAPTISCLAVVLLECPEDESSVAPATTTDNCDPAPSLTSDDVITPGDCPQEYTVMRTYTATDECGNETVTVQTITISDDTAPEITCPPDAALTCNADYDPQVTGSATATDVCCDPVITFVDSIFATDCPLNSLVERTWTATDACGNSSSCVQTITLTDEEAPEIFCADDVTISCEDMLADVVPATTTDNCDTAPTLEMVDVTNPGPCVNTYSITRTYTATDACGNQSTHLQTIHVEDTEAPLLTCPGLVELSCTDDLGSVALATATDNCDGAPAVTFDDTTEPGSCPQESTITRVFTATDECGNSSTTTQIITITDEEPPVLTVEPLVELDCTESVDDVALGTATDNCDLDPVVTFEDETTLLGCAQTYSILRTYTATDACGNTSTAEQTINVTDSEPPTISCLAEVFLECPDDETTVAPATVIDNCDPAPSLTSTDSIEPGACPQEYTVTRTYTAIDECGNETVTIQTITISDDTAPELNCPADITLECFSEYGPDIAGSATATDLCCEAPEITWIDSIFATVCPLDSRIERTWTATDACGNATSCVQTILLVDDTAPEIFCAEDVTINCDDDLADVALATTTDNCDAAPTLEMADVTNPGPCLNTYSITRTYTATDACGNQSVHVQTINVVDDVAPLLTCPGLVELSCTDDLASVALATATDNCDGAPAVTFDDTTEPGDCPQESTITRVFTATDECGNSSTTTQIITITDEEPPVLTVEPLVELDCTESVDDVAIGTATDNCDGDPLVTFEDETTLLGCAQTYSILRTYTATDACGNTTTAEQTITVTDSEAPTISCLTEVFLECPDDETTVAPATTTDNCDPEPSLTSTDSIEPGACPQEYTVTRTYTATDECGNETVLVQTITISDETAPELTCPADITLTCGSEPDPLDTGFASALDACDPEPEVTFIDSIMATACPLDTLVQRTWTATDACGNTTSCIQFISITDEIAPVIDCAEDLVISCDADLEGATLAFATDNCDPAPSFTSTDVITPGACDQSQTITRTYTATDACGNSTSHVQTITLLDIEAPILDCQTQVFLSCTDDLASVPAPTATDNCDPSPSITFTETSEPGSCGSTVTRVYTATDDCGNASSQTQVINFLDDEAPQIDAPASFDLDCSDTLASVPEATVSDNCDSNPTLTVTDSGPSGPCPQSFTITRTYTATDNCGNTSSLSQTITFTDSEAPVITCLNLVELDCSESLASVAPATATDNCDDAPSLTFDDVTEPGSCPSNSTITRTYTATDACGNESTEIQVITITDSTPPALETPADLSLECGSDLEALPLATATDDCDSQPSVTHSDSTGAGSCPQETIVTRTFTATDACGNESTSTQTITLTDETAPSLTCPSDLTLTCEDDPNDMTTCGTASASDNCDPDPSVTHTDSTEPGSCAGSSTITRTWTATDACGNSSECVQTITIVDNIPPTVTCPASLTLSCTDALPPAAGATASDSCDPAPTLTHFDSALPTQTGGTGCVSESFVRTWTATDACGNSSSCEQLISIVDDEAPTIACGPASIECGEDINSVPGPTAFDNCDPDPALTFTEEMLSGDCPQAYTVVRTWTATDACGNSSTYDQVITVTDETGPEIFGPGDTELTCNEPTLFQIDVIDNCGDTTFFCVHDTGQSDSVVIEPVGPTGILVTMFTTASLTITCTALDDCGNPSAEHTFVVSAVCDQACQHEFWNTNLDDWCATGFSPADDYCTLGESATTFLDAFMITDTSAFPGFDPATTLHDALYPDPGMFAIMLRQGTAALLNASHPDIGFPATVDAVKQVMADAFDGSLTDRQAKQIFLMWNSCTGGCPLD